MTRLYAIGDIHGQRAMLEAAHARIAADRALTGDGAAPVVHLGDLCDRGPDTAGVLDFLCDGLARGEPWIALKGNHDRIMADHAAGREAEVDFPTWVSASWGGGATLASYGVGGWTGRARAFRAAVPAAHRALLDSLPLWHQTDDLLLVHAGIRPGLAISEQAEDDLLWIRADFLWDARDHGRLVVHGHTPVKAPEHRGNRVGLDTGAGKGRPLTAAVFEGRRVWILGEAGRQELLPD